VSDRGAALWSLLEPRERDLLAEVATLAAPGRTALVGGAVRDLLLGQRPQDLDVTLEADVEGVARALADAWGGECRVHGRFGTASVWPLEGPQVDLAACRAERYPYPGALPEVQAAPLEQDLARRDFTIHAMALVFGGGGEASLLDPAGGERDLADGLVRVLREDSFAEDPTRMLRAVRYVARLGFVLEPVTARGLAEALDADAAATVSADRLWREWQRAVDEDDTPAQLAVLGTSGVARALALPARTAEQLLERAGRVEECLAIRQRGLDPAEAHLAGWLHDADDAEREAALARLAVPEARHPWFGPQDAPGDLTDPGVCYEVFEALPGPARAALCADRGGPALDALRRFEEELRLVHPLLDGHDLLALGLPPGPRYRDVLHDLFRRQLRGEVRDREQALEAARERLRGLIDG